MITGTRTAILLALGFSGMTMTYLSEKNSWPFYIGIVLIIIAGHLSFKWSRK